jgi:hypothetical protein
MIIYLIDRKIYTFRYLPKIYYKSISFFFAGGNVAYRKKALNEDFFDNNLLVGEDVDIGIRLSRSGEMFSNPRAKVIHTGRIALGKILRQWFLTAIYQVKILKKYVSGGIEVFINTLWEDKEHYFECVYQRKSKWTIIIFLTPFFFVNVFLWVTLITGALKLPHLYYCSLGLLIISCLLYLRKDFIFKVMPVKYLIVFAFIRLCINSLLLYVSFFIGIRYRILYVNSEFL